MTLYKIFCQVGISDYILKNLKISLTNQLWIFWIWKFYVFIDPFISNAGTGELWKILGRKYFFQILMEPKSNMRCILIVHFISTICTSCLSGIDLSSTYSTTALYLRLLETILTLSVRKRSLTNLPKVLHFSECQTINFQM